MSRTIWSRQSRADLDGIDDYLRADDPDRADRFGRLAIGATRLLEEMPYVGTPIERDFRKWRVPDTPYLLIYRVGKNGIEIARVRHDRENWWP